MLHEEGLNHLQPLGSHLSRMKIAIGNISDDCWDSDFPKQWEWCERTVLLYFLFHMTWPFSGNIQQYPLLVYYWLWICWVLQIADSKSTQHISIETHYVWRDECECLTPWAVAELSWTTFTLNRFTRGFYETTGDKWWNFFGKCSSTKRARIHVHCTLNHKQILWSSAARWVGSLKIPYHKHMSYGSSHWAFKTMEKEWALSLHQ